MKKIYGIGISSKIEPEKDINEDSNAEAVILNLDHLIQSANTNYNQYLELTGNGKVLEAAEAFEALGQDLRSLVKREYINQPSTRPAKNN